jgi:RNA polymerase sigma-54 factor
MKPQIFQDQRQILTPLLVQQMELLSLPLPELREKILEEAEKNPLIKLENPIPSSAPRKRQPSLMTAPDFVFENQSSSQGILEHILEQIHLVNWSDREEQIALLILTSLDNHGFLRIDPSILLEGTDFTPTEFETVRQKLMRLDPEGLGSRNALEFLLFQAEEEYGKESLEALMLRETPDLVEKKQLPLIAKHFHASREDVQMALKNLAELRPSPVIGWGEAALAIIPEAFVEIHDDTIDIRLNEYYIPDVRLDQYYLSLVTEDKTQKEEKKFLRNNLAQAKTLIENLQSRKEIVFRVIHAIINHQKDYFTKGPQYQKPLRLHDIAEELGIHESTVSRVVKDKYIQVGGRIIPLKHFFSSQIKTTTRENVSSKSIQDMIVQIIANEDKNNPLSDEQIVSILENKGIKISRRTIAKYRSLLHFPPAHERKIYE